MGTFYSILSYIKNDLFTYEEREIYLVEIIYKNGKSKTFWCSEYTVSSTNCSFKFLHSEKYPDKGLHKPLALGEDISSVWQVDIMKVKV